LNSGTMSRPKLINLTASRRTELGAMVARSSSEARLVRRARVVLLSADGVSGAEIATRLDLTPEAVSRIRRRFHDKGIAGLAERHRSGRKDNKVPPATVERIESCNSRCRHRLLGVVVGRRGFSPRPSATRAGASPNSFARADSSRKGPGSVVSPQMLAQFEPS
jgi:hypothetical protein